MRTTITRTIKKATVAMAAASMLFVSIGKVAPMASVRADGTENYNPNIVTFVTSLYSDCLGRQPDPTGLNDWCNKLTTGRITGKQCAYGFFFSPEFLAKANTLSDTQLIEAYYRVFLNRTSDPTGASYWASRIANTTNDVSILFTGFADSAEFASKCQSYGVTVGNHVSVPTTTRGISSTSAAAASSGMTASSPSELDAYWTQQGYEIRYIDLGNGNTQKCYAKFYDMTEHYRLVNEWRAQNGHYALTPITDPNDVRYQFAQRRAIEVSYMFMHRSPKNVNEGILGGPDRPSGEAGENITTAENPVRAFENFKNSPMHNAAMMDEGFPDLRVASMVAATCTVMFVNPDGVSVTQYSPYQGSANGYGRGTVQLFYYG